MASKNTVFQSTLEAETLLQNFSKSIISTYQRSGLDALFIQLEKIKAYDLQKSKEQKILDELERRLIEKYRLAAFQEISRELPPYQDETLVDGAAKKIPSFFVKDDKMEDVVHPALGSLSDYIWGKNKGQYIGLFDFCKGGMCSSLSNYLAVKSSFISYILEVEVKEPKRKHKRIKSHYDIYKSELAIQFNWDFFDRQILAAIVINFLLMLFVLITSGKYEWNTVIQSMQEFEKYRDYIEKNGPSSKSCRELLAFVFNINLRIYAQDKNDFSLVFNHNPLSKRKIYLLKKNDEFTYLDVDEEHLRLYRDARIKCEVFKNIFAKLESYKRKEEFDSFLANKEFLNINFINQDKASRSDLNDVKNIIKYFPAEAQQELQMQLEVIKPKYIGEHGILRYIGQHFSNYGRQVSLKEINFLIRSVLTSVAEDGEELVLFSWIVAAYPQKSWIDELLLIKFENYFKKRLVRKPKIREYLSKIANKNILLMLPVKLEQQTSKILISYSCIEETLYLLSVVSCDEEKLRKLGLSEWSYALKSPYWNRVLLGLIDWKDNEKLSTASYYLTSAENVFGPALVQNLTNTLISKKSKLTPDIITFILFNLCNENWNLCEEDLRLLKQSDPKDWIQKMQEKVASSNKDRKISELIELIRNNGNTSKGVLDNMPKIKKSFATVFKQKFETFTESDIQSWIFKQIFVSIFSNKEESMKMLRVIDRAVELKRGFRLRDAQKLAVLALLENKRTLAQISTGEGKSLIIVAASIMIALARQKVFVITSSTVLAKRDAECNKDIYHLFGINASHNCSENFSERKLAYLTNQVIYGELSDFQRDYLLNTYYGESIPEGFSFVNIILDEADSMLLDNGEHVLSLGLDFPELDKLESVYLYIWQWLNKPVANWEEYDDVMKTERIKEAVLNDLYGSLQEEDIGKLSPELGEKQTRWIWKSLIKAGIIDSSGRFLKENFESSEIHHLLTPDFNIYEDRLVYLLKECVDRDKAITIPCFLKSFVKRNLAQWIASAKQALVMEAGDNYVVDVDRTEASPDPHPNIIVLDTSTGTDSPSCKYSDALHQFLQLKHGCKMSPKTEVAIFVSNVGFIKQFEHIYGLTGTLGSLRERDLLKEMYEVDFVTIPTNKPKRFNQEKPIFCTSKDEWIKRIYAESLTMIKKQRSVLIICQTVNLVETLYNAFGGKEAKIVLTYKRDYEEFDIAQGKNCLAQGKIIIATNLAGRGSDIKITEALRRAGGLHVILTYIPVNLRIEQQAFGRASRNGDEGSGRLIIPHESAIGESTINIFDLKRERDSEELNRISKLKDNYETKITYREICLKKFTGQFEKLEKMLSGSIKDPLDIPMLFQPIKSIIVDALIGTRHVGSLENKDDLKKILKNACIEKFAFWLDANKDDEYDINEFISTLKKLKFDKIQDLLAWVEDSPIQMTELGKHMISEKLFDFAIQCFDEVIKKEPDFSAAAHYYKAYAISRKIDFEKKPLDYENKKIYKEFKYELREAKRCLDKYIEFSILGPGIIGKINDNIDAYQEQKQNLCNLYHTFSLSIDNILGHVITPQSFIDDDIKDDLAEIIYDELLKEEIISKSKVKWNIPVEKLKKISYGYGIQVETLQKFLLKYRNRAINEVDFQKALKKELQLPSREAFWKHLVNQKILNNEVKYVVIDNNRLNQINPSLDDFLTQQIAKNEIKQHLFVTNDESIFLNVEQIGEPTIGHTIFNKYDFIKLVGKEKYSALKNKRVFSSNKKGFIDKKQIKSASFPKYDSITLQDFTCVNIPETEAKKILQELLKQNVIKKTGTSYKLKIAFDEIARIQIPFCPAYENAVKELLFACFIYKISLQIIESKLGKENTSLQIPLQTKPHLTLFGELLEQRIVKPSLVTPKYKNIKEKLQLIFNRTISRSQLENMFSQGTLRSEECTEDLFNCLMEKNWIRSFMLPGFFGITLELLLHVMESDKRQPELPSKYKNIEKTLKKIFDNRVRLTEEYTIQIIAKILERSRSLLKSLDVPDGKLVSFNDFCGELKGANEKNILFLNGLDQIILLEEKKWTRRMLFNVFIVFAMGIAQIAIGTVIELFSLGAMTHVGSAFVSEGVSDIFFGLNALKSGYFRWEDYKQHKIQSLITTAISCFISAGLSRGVKFSRFGHKLGGPSYQHIYGMELIKMAGPKVVFKEVAKRIAMKTIEAFAFGLSNVGVDELVKNKLHSCCENIASTIYSNIGQVVENHKVSESLKKACKILGEKKAKKLIDNLASDVFSKETFTEKYKSVATKIVACVFKGFGDAIGKINKTGVKTAIPALVISLAGTFSDPIINLQGMSEIAGEILDELDKKIKIQLDKAQKRGDSDSKNESEEVCERFRKDTINDWKLLINKRVEKVVEQHVITPILRESAHYITRYVGKTIQKQYRACKENEYFKRYEKLKKEYEGRLRESTENEDNNSKVEEHIKNKYEEDLLKLMTKTRDPKLLAAIIRGDVPMDMTCVEACADVVQKLLKEQGIYIEKPKITVDGDVEQTFHEGGGEEIKLNLKDKHFQSGNSNKSKNKSSQSDNDCLYEAFSEIYPELKNVNSKKFREAIADHIENDPKFQRHIKENWHKLPISRGGFGGATNKRFQSKVVADPESSSTCDYEDYQFRERDVNSHLVDRLERFMRYGGTEQRISEKTKVSRLKLVEDGPSHYQDQRSHRGKDDLDAAHVIRLGKINEKLGTHDQFKKGESSPDYNELANSLGHTQNVPKYANRSKIGRGIDHFQSQNHKKVGSIDFSGELNEVDYKTIQDMKEQYLSNLEKFNVNDNPEIAKAIQTIKNTSVEQLFQKGKEGHSGIYKDIYQQPYRKHFGFRNKP